MPSTKLISQFWSKVEVSGLDECWLWKAGLTPSGYGKFSTGGRHGLSQRAPRAAYILTHGPIVGDYQVLHSCDNRPCCNPSHLRLGTNQENSEDKVSHGKNLIGEMHPMVKLSEDEVQRIRKDTRVNRAIAKEYGVGHQAISKIKRGLRWTHV